MQNRETIESPTCYPSTVAYHAALANAEAVAWNSRVPASTRLAGLDSPWLRNRDILPHKNNRSLDTECMDSWGSPPQQWSCRSQDVGSLGRILQG